MMRTCELVWLGLVLVVLCAGARAQEADSAPPNWPDAPAGATLREDGWFAPRTPTIPIPQLPDEVTDAYVIPVRDPITNALADTIGRKVMLCKARGAELVIFDMDTPGGDSRPMKRICDMITEDLAGAYTVAFVNPDAYSAGAIISLACDEIIVTPSTKIGAATPILIDGQGGLVPIPEAERAKFEAPARAEIRLLAEQNGYPIPLCESMITMGIEVWLVRHEQTGELKLVDPAGEGWRQKVANPPGDEPDPGAGWRYLRTVDADDEVLVLTGKQAVQIGLANQSFSDLPGVFRHFGLAGEANRLTDTWSETLVRFLTHPVVAGLLFMLGILGAYTEIRSPGFGVPGFVAIVCFALVFGSRYLSGMAEWWEMAVLAIGLVLLILEVAVIPGFGIAGVAGLICILVGLLAIILPNTPGKLPIPRTDLDWEFFTDGLFSLMMGLVLAVIGVAVLSKYLPKIPIANKLILAAAGPYEQTTATEAAPVHGVVAGDIGVVEGMCRPIGKVRFGEALVDAVTEGDSVEPGRRVRVLHRDGNRVVVERIDDE